jgi:hypothetical protein
MVDNMAPSVSAGDNQTKGTSFTQTGTATDTNAMTYTWTKQSGPGTLNFGTADALSTTISVTQDGTYTIRLTATDAAGNSSFNEMTLVWDTVAPTLSISTPSATLTKSGPVTYTVTYAGADSVALAPVNVTLIKTGTANGAISVSDTGNTTRTVTISGVTGDGTLGISIEAGTAIDVAGNLASASGPSTIFTVDNTVPTVSAGTNQTKGSAFIQTGTATDTSGLTYGWSQVSGPGTVNFGSPNEISTAISASANGVYVIRFTVTDAAGNMSYSDTTLTWDATAPSVIIGAPSVTVTNGGPVTYAVTYTGADAITLATADVTLIKTGTADGTVSVSGAGNTTRIVTISSITGDGTLGISIAAGTAIDTAENPATAPEPSATFTVDNTAPVVSTGDNQTKGTAFTQTGTATDLNAMTYSWTKQTGPGAVNFGTADALSTTISATQDGTYIIRFTATDKAGNSSYSDMTLVWDATAPVTTANPAGGSYGLPQIVTLSATETATIYYTTDGSDPTESSSVYSAPIAIAATTTLKYFAKDPAGNAEPMKTQTYTIDKSLNGIQGDINGDGAVTLADAIAALQVMANMQPQSLREDYTLSNADVNGDGRVGVTEAIYILQQVAGER